MMRTMIAVVGRVFVQCIGDRLDDDIEVRIVTGRNVRIIELFWLNCRVESGGSCHAMEAEHQFLIRAAIFRRSFGRLCGL